MAILKASSTKLQEIGLEIEADIHVDKCTIEEFLEKQIRKTLSFDARKKEELIPIKSEILAS